MGTQFNYTPAQSAAPARAPSLYGEMYSEIPTKARTAAYLQYALLLEAALLLAFGLRLLRPRLVGLLQKHLLYPQTVLLRLQTALPRGANTAGQTPPAATLAHRAHRSAVDNGIT